MPEQAPEPPPPITLSVNAIVNGVHVRAGEVLPVTAENLPESLKPFVVPERASKEARANCAFNTTRHLTRDRRWGRQLSQHEAAELAADLAAQPCSEEILAEMLRPGHLAENPPYVQVNP